MSKYSEPDGESSWTTPTPNEEVLDACRVGDLTKLRSIIGDKDADRSTMKMYLEEAAKQGQTEIIRYLLEFDPAIKIDAWVASSAAWGGLEVYRLLHSKRPEMIQDHFGHLGDAVHVATRTSNYELLRYLLENGADPGRTPDCCRYMYHFPPIESAVLCSGPGIARLLIEHGATLSKTVALEYAAHLGRLSMVQCLLDEGAEVNYIRDPTDPEYDGFNIRRSALHSAVRASHIAVIKILLDHGADPMLSDSAGQTSLDEARAIGCAEIVQMLELPSFIESRPRAGM